MRGDPASWPRPQPLARVGVSQAGQRRAPNALPPPGPSGSLRDCGGGALPNRRGRVSSRRRSRGIEPGPGLQTRLRPAAPGDAPARRGPASASAFLSAQRGCSARQGPSGLFAQLTPARPRGASVRGPKSNLVLKSMLYLQCIRVAFLDQAARFT